VVLRLESGPLGELFIARWQRAGGSERANYQLFLTELCELLGCRAPTRRATTPRQRLRVRAPGHLMRQPDGSASNGFIDLYRRGAFVLEAKQKRQATRQLGLRRGHAARPQPGRAVRPRPARRRRPPAVPPGGRRRPRIELYAEFSRSGATYTRSPIRAATASASTTCAPDIRERLRQVWLDPLALDPARRSARVTREIATGWPRSPKVARSRRPPAEPVASS
jgi:hypothetical protein